MKRRGFSLLEAMVALAVGSGLAVAGLVLTADFHKHHHRHTSELESNQRLRRALELLGQDVRNAGVGVGYRPDGRFAGFLTGSFQVEGGATFQADDRAISTVDGPLMVDDLGIRRALGERRTVLYLEGGTGEICSGLSFEPNELVSVTARHGRGGKTLRVQSASPTACSRGVCVGGCTLLGWAPDPTFVSHPEAETDSFTAGDLFLDYETVVWFIAPDEDGHGQLRRVGRRTQDACAAPDASCGALVSEGVELLQVAFSAWDPATGQWVPVSRSQDITTRNRLRADLELVARGRGDPGLSQTPAIRSQIRPGTCVPSPCDGAEPDGVPRVALRTSVEVRNVGRLQIR